MTINTTRIVTLAVVLFVSGSAVSSVIGQQTISSNTQPMAVIKYDGEMASLLATLAEQFSVTIGMEVDSKYSTHVSLFLREATLADVLNAIVKSAPSYQWRELNGCIEVLPVKAGNSLLDKTISNFWISDVVQTEAVNRLMNQGEVQGNLEAMGLTRRETGSAEHMNNTRFSLDLQGVTIRQALHQIAKESGGRFWLFQTRNDGSFSIRNSPY